MSEKELNPDQLREIIAGEDERERADALVNLGIWHSQQEDWAEAGSCFGSAADIFEKLENHLDQLHALRFVADNLVRQGRREESVEVYRKTLELANQEMDVRSQGFAAGAMGDQLRATRRYDEALEAHQIAVSAFQEVEEPLLVGINLMASAHVLHRRNQMQAAADNCSLAYSQFQLASNPYEAAVAKEYLGYCLSALGEHDEAVAHISDALGVMYQLDEKVCEMGEQFALGQALLEAGRLPEAADQLAELVESLRESRDFSGAADAELYLAVAKFRQNIEHSYEMVQKTLPRLRAFFDASGSAINVVKADQFTAEWYSLQGAWPKAAQVLRHVVTRCQELDEPNLERSTRARLAQALIQIGEREEAAEVLAQVSETEWGDVRSEIELLARLRETLNLEVEPTAN